MSFAQTQVDSSAAQDSAVIVDQKKGQDAPPTDAKPASSLNIKIGIGDLLEMKVFGVPEMEQESRVNGDGNITVPLIGVVHVEGNTSEQAEKLIENQLADGGYLRDPHVSIFVKEYVTQGISIMGEVQKPGIYPLLGARRLFDALSSAGGTTNRAGRVVSITRRDDAQHPLMVQLTGDPAQSAASNVEIQPGDTIVVAKAGVVYVVGDVERPGGFVMDNNESLTVLQALALAMGQKSTASLDKAKIIRKDPSGLKEVPVPLKKILQGKSTDIAMQGDDILFVPASAGKGAMRRTAEAVVQTATGVAIYRR